MAEEFLVEELQYAQVSKQLAALPRSLPGSINFANLSFQKTSTERLLPPAHLIKADTNETQIARVDQREQPGVVLDYIAVNSGEANFVFQGDTTYYIDGTLFMVGQTIFEGGAVLKYPENESGCVVPDYQGLISCQTARYRPVVLTSVNDNTVGDVISGSTGNPTNPAVFSPGYFESYISFQDNSTLTECDLSNIRALYAGAAIEDDFEDGSVQLQYSDSQFVNCYFAIFSQSRGRTGSEK